MTLTPDRGECRKSIHFESIVYVRGVRLAHILQRFGLLPCFRRLRRGNQDASRNGDPFILVSTVRLEIGLSGADCSDCVALREHIDAYSHLPRPEWAAPLFGTARMPRTV